MQTALNRSVWFMNNHVSPARVWIHCPQVCPSPSPGIVELGEREDLLRALLTVIITSTCEHSDKNLNVFACGRVIRIYEKTTVVSLFCRGRCSAAVLTARLCLGYGYVVLDCTRWRRPSVKVDLLPSGNCASSLN